MGKLTVRFKCQSCGYCCTEVICLPTPADVARISKETGEDPHDFLEFLTTDEVGEVDDSDPTWLECDDERYIMALKRIKKGCYFIDEHEKTCSIYESRPILCCMYPFKLHETRNGDFKAFSLHKDIECPKKRDDVFKTGALYELYQKDRDYQDDYDLLVEVFNNENHSDPTEFIAMFYGPESRKHY